MKRTYPPGATPLDPDETAGLLPTSISTQAELNEFAATASLPQELLETVTSPRFMRPTLGSTTR